jgi:hypothetical protein
LAGPLAISLRLVGVNLFHSAEQFVSAFRLPNVGLGRPFVVARFLSGRAWNLAR